MDYEEFRKSVLKVNEKRNHRIKNSIGVQDIFRIATKANWYKGEKPESVHEYHLIIRKVNDLIAKELIAGKDIIFPKRLGSLEVRKYNTFVKFEDGRLKTNRKVDWPATLKLWHEDEEARVNKVLVRVETDNVFTIYYNKYRSNFRNKQFFQFLPNRDIRVAIKHAGTNGDIDAFNLKTNG